MFKHMTLLKPTTFTNAIQRQYLFKKQDNEGNIWVSGALTRKLRNLHEEYLRNYSPDNIITF